jgi:TonB family protein
MKAHAVRMVAVFVCAFLLLLLLSKASEAQASPSEPNLDPAIAGLADRIAENLHKVKAKRVALFDFQGPEHETHPVGKLFAEQLAFALQTAAPDLQFVDRSKLVMTVAAKDGKSDASAYRKFREVAKKAGANSLVTGKLARISERIGITLSVQSLSREGGADVTGALPITDEMLALSSEPIPTFHGIPRAGAGGFTSPTCKYCSLPEYTEQARAAKFQGDVTLAVVVTAEGSVGNVVVLRGPGYGLEERSAETVRKWKFNPALDVEGKPSTVVVEIEVTFRYF